MMTQVEHPELYERLQQALDSGVSAEVRAVIADLHPADIAVLLESLPPDERRSVWVEASVERMGEVLTEVSDRVRENLVEGMDPHLLAVAVSFLDIDDLADIAPELPDEVVAGYLFTVDKAERSQADAVLGYPENTAGGLMDLDTTSIRNSISLTVVLRYLRLKGELPEYTDKLFVVDRDHRLKGILFLATVLTTDPATPVGDVADRDPITFNALTSSTEVANAFERYNLISAPVLDDDGRLLGRITIDDVVDVIREEADRSVMSRAGLSEDQDIFASVMQTSRSRALWLGVNLLTAILASWVIGRFESTIEKMVALAVLMPIVASMGGNAGTQTVTVVIRGLAVGTITSANALRVLRKECLVGGFNGLIWAAVMALVAGLWFQNLHLGLVIALAMIINLLASALAGVLIPVIFNRIGIDPALASGVALTTVTDVVGFLAVLGLATLFLV